MTNMQKIKQDKKITFRYGSFIICLVFYFLGTVPGFGKIQWAYDRLIEKQILDKQGDKSGKQKLWVFLKTFEEEIKNRSLDPQIYNREV